MAGALRPAKGRNFPPIPCDSSLNSFLYPMPIMLSEALAFHGHGGIFAACRMRCIRKNRKKRHIGENIFSPCRFSVFYRARGNTFQLLMFHAEICSFSQIPFSQSGVQRMISSGAGYRGRGGPCPAALYFQERNTPHA